MSFLQPSPITDTALTKMNGRDFKEFLEKMIPLYAENKSKNGDWKIEESLEKSKAAYARLLPDGLNTPNHFLLNIEHSGLKMGYLWWTMQEDGASKTGFLYEITIFEEFRNRGLGTLAMQLFIDAAKQENVDRIMLHVFGFNSGAVRLYQRLGFGISDYTMQLKNK